MKTIAKNQVELITEAILDSRVNFLAAGPARKLFSDPLQADLFQAEQRF